MALPNVNLVYTYQSAKADLVNTITDTVSGIKQTFTYDNEDQLTDYVVSGGSRNGLKRAIAMIVMETESVAQITLQELIIIVSP